MKLFQYNYLGIWAAVLNFQIYSSTQYFMKQYIVTLSIFATKPKVQSCGQRFRTHNHFLENHIIHEMKRFFNVYLRSSYRYDIYIWNSEYIQKALL